MCVAEEVDALRPLLREMRRCVLATNGRGLAAPQLGESIRVFLIAESQPPLAMFNPRIVRASRAKAHRWESCLSIPDQMGLVERARSVEIEFEDIEGRAVRSVLRGPPAAVFQHELDHLNGVLFVDVARKTAPMPGIT